MWYEIVKFELLYRKKRPATYIYFLLVFTITLILISTNSIGRMGGAGLVKENAPFVIALFMTKVSLVFTVLTSAIMGVPVLRDFEHRTESILFINPISKADYLLGRFLGSFIVLILIASAVILAGILSEVMPWRNHANMLPFHLKTYIQPFITIVLPNLFISSAIFFAGGTLSRKSIVVYTQGLILLVLLLIAQGLIPNIENRILAGIIDPFASIVVKMRTIYWSVAERNMLYITFEDNFLINRVVWVGFAIAVLLFTHWKFSFNLLKVAGPIKNSKKSSSEQVHIDITTPKIEIRFNFTSDIIKMLRLSVFYAKSLFREGSFVAIVIAGFVLLIIK